MNDAAAAGEASDATQLDTRALAAQPIVKTSGAQPEGNVKDTIESIIIAFILAFIFRGFVVEAFVIPTGSMAPTLLGAHMRFHCPDCGYRYDVNFGSESPNEIHIPDYAVTQTSRGVANRVMSIHCPNCGYKLPRVDLSDPRNDATGPPIRYGDRILVLKYVYLFSDPRRWDVVVFKSPSEAHLYDYTQNYIKRLVGKPNEAVFILDGDVYVGTHDAKPEEFIVQTKSRPVQEALWRIVHHNDYLPRGVGNWTQPWKMVSGTGWDTEGRQFKFDNQSDEAIIRFDADANPGKHALTDWLEYNVTANQLNRGEADTYVKPGYPPDNAVSDIKLSFYHKRHEGDGPLRVSVTKLDTVFVATIAGNTATLKMTDRTGSEVAIAENVKLPNPGPGGRHIEFVNADYQATLRIDGTDVIRTTPEQYRPDIPRLLQAAERNERLPKPQIALSAARQRCTISHLSLWRDVYYGIRDLHQKLPVQWGSPLNFPQRVMYLGPDEYFVLGDNSPISGDARMWTQGIELPAEGLSVEAGKVPGRFLIGRAFFVYWPAGYRPIDTAPALVPNFGDMRFIH